MEKTTKVLLVICLILLTGLSLTVGLLLGGQFNRPATLNTTNNTTPDQTTVNNTTNEQNTQNIQPNQNNKPLISAAEANRIATNRLHGYDVHGANAKLITGSQGTQIYVVSLYNNSDGSYAGQVLVDAQTGEFLG